MHDAFEMVHCAIRSTYCMAGLNGGNTALKVFSRKPTCASYPRFTVIVRERCSIS